MEQILKNDPETQVPGRSKKVSLDMSATFPYDNLLWKFKLTGL